MAAKPAKLTYTLMDGEERHRENPATFEIPSQKERTSIEVGKIVKLGFELPEKKPGEVSGERMWVKVTRVEKMAAGRRYTGEIQNHPVVIPGLKHSDTVVFFPRHIIATMDDA